MSEATEAMTPRPTDAWEKRRREDMRIRDRRYGFFRVVKEKVQSEFCAACTKEVIPSPNNIRVQEGLFHGDCYVRCSRASRKNSG